MRATVLIVDDDEALNNMLAELLREEGFKVLQEFRGSRGLNTAINRSPDVVILDVKTADVQGLEALHALRSRRIPTRVVIYTGQSTTPADIVQFIRAGATDYVSKSGDPEMVLNAVERTLALDATLDRTGRASAVAELHARLDEMNRENIELKRSVARHHATEMGARSLQATLVIAVLGSFRYLDIVTLDGASGLSIVGVVFAALFLPVDRLVRLTVSAFGGRTDVKIATIATEATRA